MNFTIPSWRHLAGQNDVHAALHVPVVYENIPSQPLCWEYHVLSVDAREEALPDEERLNKLGTQGWLLVSVVEESASGTRGRVNYYFVRQREA